MRRALAILIVLLAPLSARADFLWDLRVGAKAALTGNLWGPPDGAPKSGGHDAGWMNTLAWVGGGGGLTLELHALTFLALEVDVLYEQNGFKESIKGTTDSPFFTPLDLGSIYTKYTQVRVPVLLKGVLPLGLVELSLGVGPEFTFGRSAWLDTTKYLTSASAGLDAASVNDVFVDVDLGVTFRVWKLAIPLSLRTAFNVTQPKGYYDRFDTLTAESTIVKASETYQFALLAGVAYVF